MQFFRPLILAFLLAADPAGADTALPLDTKNLPTTTLDDSAIVDLSHDTFDGRYLGPNISWYKGEEPINLVADSNFEDRFERGTSAVLNHGYTSANYWYRIRFFNPYAQVEKIHIHDPHNVYDDFEVYRGKELVGSLHHRDTLKKRIVTIDLPAESLSSIYIRKKTDAVVHQSSFTFWRDYESLRDSIQSSELRYQTVLTMLLMSVFLTTTLLFAYRKIIYFHYLGYLLSFVMFASWVWSVHYFPWLMRWGGMLSLFCVVFTALFVDEFLEIKRHSPSLHKLFITLACLSFLSMGIEFVDPIMRAYTGTILSTSIQATTVCFGTMLFFKYRQIHILIFNVAFGSFLISGFIQMQIWMGLIDSAENLLMFYGVAAENFLMLLAMGHRIVVIEGERKQSDNLLAHSYEQLSKVFYPHQILQIRDGRTVEETMPVGEKDACILYFHIMDGAALMHEGYEDYVEEFMVRCRQLLMEHYDPLNFRCNAYMIREMGDGFLCSVGYPFHQTGRLKSESAVELAEKLILEFNAMVASLDAPQNLHCSIGIVRGLVKSYFSRSGRIRDDLWGRSISMASVYGEVSSQLFASLGMAPGNIIILHDAVFNSLPRDKRQSYEVISYQAAQGLLGRFLEGDSLAFRIFNQDTVSLTKSKTSMSLANRP
jgi:hypothetical protein